MYTVLATAINHPDPINPYQGLFNRRILQALSSSGIDLDAVSPRPYAPPVGPYSSYGSIPRTEEWGSYTVHHPRFWYLLPKRLFYGLSGCSYANRVPDYVEVTFERPDVVHACHLYPDGYGMLPYVRRHDLPLFVVAHGTLLNSFSEQPRGVREKIRTTLREATGVLCVSDDLAETAREFVDPASVRTVPIGADPERFPTGQRDRIRRELDISPDETVILFVGGFTESKGVGELCEVLPHLDVPDATFAFVGHTGDMEPELRSAVAESRFSSRFIYSGLPPVALRRWFAIADLLVLPSHTEGRPTVIYEAMASETAVLGTTVGGIPEQVADGETGVLIPPRDVDALRTALGSLACDRDRLRRMGEAGRDRLRERGWTWIDHADQVRSIHRTAID